jgi:hypothetical protein
MGITESFAVRPAVPKSGELVPRIAKVHGGFDKGLVTAPAVYDRPPPLRGHLRLVGGESIVPCSMELVYELRNRINFRSVEFEELYGSHPQHILNGCARALEHLTIILRECGTYQLSPLSFTMTKRLANFLSAGDRELGGIPLIGLKALRRLTLCMSFRSRFAFKSDHLFRVLSTVKSPAFCEFDLELNSNGFPPLAKESSDCWEEIDKVLEE